MCCLDGTKYLCPIFLRPATPNMQTFEKGATPCIMINEHGIIEKFNENAVAKFGFTKEEAIVCCARTRTPKGGGGGKRACLFAGEHVCLRLLVLVEVHAWNCFTAVSLPRLWGKASHNNRASPGKSVPRMFCPFASRMCFLSAWGCVCAGGCGYVRGPRVIRRGG